MHSQKNRVREIPRVFCLLSQPVDVSWMQAVAWEMNLSETAFLVPEHDGFVLHWFTPRFEVELCGHATLTSAHLLWQQGYLRTGERDIQPDFRRLAEVPVRGILVTAPADSGEFDFVSRFLPLLSMWMRIPLPVRPTVALGGSGKKGAQKRVPCAPSV